VDAKSNRRVANSGRIVYSDTDTNDPLEVLASNRASYARTSNTVLEYQLL
jgi:hypothetical protein